MPLLYYNSISPAARFARILLAEKERDVDARVEKDWERREAFLALNPEGAVPVLRIDGGQAICGPLAIAEYLEETDPEPALIGTDPGERAEARRLMAWFLIKCEQEAARPLLAEKVLNRLDRRTAPNTTALRAAHYNLDIHLEYLDFLSESRHYLAGRYFSAADAAAAAMVSVFDYLGDIAWDRHAPAKDWYMRVKSRKSVRLILADRIPGHTPPGHYDQLDF